MRKHFTRILILTIIVLFALLITIMHTDNVAVTQTRTSAEVQEIQDITMTQLEKQDTPIGVENVYTFTLPNEISYDTNLAFYTVHQIVTVYIDGEKVYNLQPANTKRITKTVASNWVMIPLYNEDNGKQVRVEITPVYESFKNREVIFLIGSSLAIYRNRLAKDLPQIILGSMAIIIGVIFICISVYSKFKKNPQKKLAILGLFSIMIGLWKLTDTRFTPFMDNGEPVFVYYITITIPMLGMLPLVEWTKDIFSQKAQKILQLYELVITIQCLVELLIQWLGIFDIREMTVFTHISLGIGAIIFVMLGIMKDIKKAQGENLPIQIRMAVICVLGIFGDVIAFYIKGNSSGLIFSLMAFLIYIVFMGINTMFEYGRQQIQIAKLDRELAETERQMAQQNRELAEKEHKLTDSRIKMMMSQIRSHFIFNVLATISTYCKIDPKTADKALICFSRYLRRNINIIEEDGLIDFSLELEQLEDYIKLEQLRFAENITFEKDIETSSFKLPPLTVQPIVENSIKHGLVEHGRTGTVFLHTRRTDNIIEIIVSDDGVGFDPQMLENTTSVGIKNVRYRLKTMVNGSLKVDSKINKGTTVTIKIPINNTTKGD